MTVAPPARRPRRPSPSSPSAASASALAQGTVLRIVPHSNLAILDPIWTTAYMSRNHGYMIYDTLFGTDENAKIKPQMVEIVDRERRQPAVDLQAAQGPRVPRRQAGHRRGRDRLAAALGQARRDGQSALMHVRAAHGHAGARHLPHLPRRGLRLRPRGARQAVVERAVHHAQAHRRDRRVQADRGAHRLGPVHLQARRVQAGRQGGLPEEREVRAAQRAAVGQRPAASTSTSTASSGTWRCATRRRRSTR